MLATAYSTTLDGLQAHLVKVEVDSARGPASFDVVGLPEVTVRESRFRVRSALGQFGIQLDEHRVTVSLAPGDLRKTGSAFDLAIALAILAAIGKIPARCLESVVLLGELSLTGELQPVRGVLPQLMQAKTWGSATAIVPKANEAEASVITGLTSLVAHSLSDVTEHFSGVRVLKQAVSQPANVVRNTSVDLADVRGQHSARRALEIAAAGHHHLLMIGPPGGGKTMLARRIPTILPLLSRQEALETSAVHSISGTLPANQGMLSQRPFRSPHHTISDAGLVGGGFPPRPGELSLAHRGVLFLDELPEFRRSVLEALRQPLEDGVLTIARARSRVTFPSEPLVVGASNPCPCGYYQDGSQRCQCSPERVRRYLSRLSGPLLDRLDIQIFLPPLDVATLVSRPQGEPSEVVRKRVLQAREIQFQRWEQKLASVPTNGGMSSRDLDSAAPLSEPCTQLLTHAAQNLGFSARSYSKIRKLARTIADLEGNETIVPDHIAEAIQLRSIDRMSSNIQSTFLPINTSSLTTTINGENHAH
jgi:magnesium chelatase family protein